jgi:hypothetical protein
MVAATLLVAAVLCEAQSMCEAHIIQIVFALSINLWFSLNGSDNNPED